MKVKEFGRVLFAKGAVRTVLEIQNVAVSTCEGGRVWQVAGYRGGSSH